MVERKKITSGTKEWASSNVNCYFGCSNNCRYCYAKKMSIRFGRKTEENWKEMELNSKILFKRFKKRNGRIMFPTSHDITIDTIAECLHVLKNLLKSGNEVLITTKPRYRVVQEIVNDPVISNLKHLVQFRFTITSSTIERLLFWEPNAPDYWNRLDALKLAFRSFFKTSISIEPFLDINPTPLIKELHPYVTETIWLGKMNYIQTNKNLTVEERKYYDYQRKACSLENIKWILLELFKLPREIKSKIRLKDSIVKILNLTSNRIEF